MTATEPLLDDAAHLLLVDDDARIRTLLAKFLLDNGYRVTAAGSAEEARTHMSGLSFDLLILDVMMPGESGLDLATWIRTASAVPILMLTALGEAQHRITGLEAGVDDYMAKPFEPRELLLRIRSILRRSVVDAGVQAEAVTEVAFGVFTYNLARGELKRGDEVIHTTDRERELLKILAEQRGGSVSRMALGGSDSGERAVDVQINRLRRKIERDPANPLFLQTVRGSGYRLLIDP